MLKDKNLEIKNKFNKDEFVNEVILEFNQYDWSKSHQSFLLYRSIIKLVDLSKKTKDPNFFISGLLFLNGLISIINHK